MPFGPHERLVAASEADLGAAASPDVQAEQRDTSRLVNELRGGFTRIYLFTWLDGDARDDEDAADVRLADLWIE